MAFNTGLASVTDGHLRAIALDPCYIPKSGKRTPGLGCFWSGTANAAKRGLEILGMALVDATDRLAVFLTAAQTFVEKRKGRIPDYLAHMDDPNSLLGLNLRAFAGVADRLRGLTSLVVTDAYFAKRTFVTSLADCQARNKNSLDFAFNASLTAVNLAKAVAKGSGLDLSVEDLKILIHNAVMAQRIFSMFGKTPNMNLNQSIFKELLFYGVKSAA